MHRSHVIVQEDNAKLHVSLNDAVIAEQSQEENCNISLASQLPNAPEYDLLYLQFFKEIQEQSMIWNVQICLNWLGHFRTLSILCQRRNNKGNFLHTSKEVLFTC